MSPKRLTFKREYSAELLRLADSDIQAAKALMNAAGVRAEDCLFHVQQAVEKAIKAVINFKGKSVLVTHDIFALIQELDGDFPPHSDALEDLTPYATIRRYEEGRSVIEEKDLKTALELAAVVLVWAEKKCKK